MTTAERLTTALECLERLGEATRPPGYVVTRKEREDIGHATGLVFVALNHLRCTIDHAASPAPVLGCACSDCQARRAQL